jgi:hypothetical protein
MVSRRKGGVEIDLKEERYRDVACKPWLERVWCRLKMWGGDFMNFPGGRLCFESLMLMN